LRAKLTEELQTAAESARRAKEAESRFNQNEAELGRTSAELQQLRTKLEQSEANWRRQLEAAQAKRVETKKGSGDEASALRRERDQLHAKLTAELQAAAESSDHANELESRLNESEAELERVNAEFKRQAANLE